MTIHLALFDEQDYSLFAQVLQNPQVMKNITGHAIDDDNIQKAWENRLMPINAKNEVAGYYKILLDGDYAGYGKLSFDDVIFDRPCIEIGYFLLPEFWGRGIGYQVGLRLINLAHHYGYPIIATVSQENHISKKLLGKLNFCFDKMIELDGKMGEVWVLKD